MSEVANQSVLQASLTERFVFSRQYRRYVLVVLMAVYLTNLIDRMLVMLLLQPIKEDLQLNDTQCSLRFW